jgi:hypothetical protein
LSLCAQWFSWWPVAKQNGHSDLGSSFRSYVKWKNVICCYLKK